MLDQMRPNLSPAENHCCPGLALEIQRTRENEMFGREAPTYKQGTQEPQAWLIAQDSINADLSSQSLRFNTSLPTSTLDA
jgi:hypothetical protein